MWTPYDREKPHDSIIKALGLIKDDGYPKTIVELGSMRMPISHTLDETDADCCCDGHSSVLFARWCSEGSATRTMHSVDINHKAVATTINAVAPYNTGNCWVHERDAFDFLNGFETPIDLLFLDAFDVDQPNCAENHLKAYQAAWNNLHEDSIILIDDCDVAWDEGGLVPVPEGNIGGKGTLVVPAALEDGWRVLWSGRQVCMIMGQQ